MNPKLQNLSFKRRHDSTMSMKSGGGRVEKVEGVCDMVFQHLKSHFQSKSFVLPSSENLQFQSSRNNGAVLLIFPSF